MINQKVREILNARHADIESEIHLYRNLNAMEKRGSKFTQVSTLAVEIEDHLINTLEVDLDELEEEEESVDDGIVSAFQQADAELKVLLTLDRGIQQLKNAGAFEDEIEGQVKFKERLQEQLFKRYGITEEDTGEENE